MAEMTKSTLEERDMDGKLIVKITIEGKTDMPFWEHDLKLEAVKALLNTVDRKHFDEDNKYEEFGKYMEEIQEILDAVREF